jgi:alpha-galactosidase
LAGKIEENYRMDRSRKIVVIGAGSSEFGMDSLAGILRTEGLHGSELVLVDIDREKLSLVEKLAQRMNREWKAEMKIWATPDRKEALPEAGFVILSVAVDRENTWKKDYELALKHGITHYSENGGPGGFAHASRNLALILPILEDIAKLAPRAFLLNFTNPLTRICTAVQTLTRIPFVGICHGIAHAYFITATVLHKELGLELPADPRFLWEDGMIERYEAWQLVAKERYAIKAAGINHFTWVFSIRDKKNGEELLPLIRRKMEELPSAFEPLTQFMTRLYGWIPVTGDTHICEYVPFTSDAREGTWRRYDIQLYDFEWSKLRRQRGLEFMRKVVAGSAEIAPLKTAISERAELLIEAMVKNAHAYEEAVNIPNQGYIRNLPENAVVEVPGFIDADGIAGQHVGVLPEAIASICRTQLTIAELNVEAFVKRDRNLVHQLFSIDPMIQDPEVAVRLADAYLETYKDSLPEFR